MLNASRTSKLSSTDPDTRLAKGRSGKFFHYNIQTAVDAAHHFIAESYVTNSPTDWGQLPDMAVSLEKEMGIVPQKMLANQCKACQRMLISLPHSL